MYQQLPELSIKYNSSNLKKRKIAASEDAFAVFKEIFDEDTIQYDESFFAIFLNVRNETLGYFKVSQGGLSGTVVDPKKIFSVGLQSGANSLIMAHNHPSQDVTPSKEDEKMTKRIREGGEILQIRLLDHLIVTKDDYFSFNDQREIL